MEFPITRAQLQTYSKNELIQNTIRQGVEYLVSQVCAGVEAHIKNKIIYNSSCVRLPSQQNQAIQQTQYVYQLNMYPREAKFCDPQIMPPVKDILPDVLKELKKKFIDCNVQTDPLNTYIIVDWS